jgi:hypothetical protein
LEVKHPLNLKPVINVCQLLYTVSLKPEQGCIIIIIIIIINAVNYYIIRILLDSAYVFIQQWEFQASWANTSLTRWQWLCTDNSVKGLPL